MLQYAFCMDLSVVAKLYRKSNFGKYRKFPFFMWCLFQIVQNGLTPTNTQADFDESLMDVELQKTT